MVQVREVRGEEAIMNRDPWFISNAMFRGKRGGDAAYYLQNVMAGQRNPGNRAHREPPLPRRRDDEFALSSGPLFPPGEFEALCKWNRPGAKDHRSKNAWIRSRQIH